MTQCPYKFFLVVAWVWYFGVMSSDGVSMLFGPYDTRGDCQEERGMMVQVTTGHGWTVGECVDPKAQA